MELRVQDFKLLTLELGLWASVFVFEVQALGFGFWACGSSFLFGVLHAGSQLGTYKSWG